MSKVKKLTKTSTVDSSSDISTASVSTVSKEKRLYSALIYLHRSLKKLVFNSILYTYLFTLVYIDTYLHSELK